MATAAIIVAAGQSRRMGFDKLFAPLGPRPVLAHSLHTFQQATCIDEIIVVTAKENESTLRHWAEEYALSKLTHIVPGGRQRHHSVQAGLEKVSDATGYVAVHDGARPLIAMGDLQRCWQLAQEHGAAACARRITDTVKRVDGHLRVMGSVDRTNLWAMETPQVFDYQRLLRCYAHVAEQDQLVTDEVSALELMGETVILSENLKPNLKITFPQDLEIAAHLLQTTEASATNIPGS